AGTGHIDRPTATMGTSSLTPRTKSRVVLQDLGKFSRFPLAPTPESPLHREVYVFMELPSRPKHDRYTRPGEYHELEQRLLDSPHPSQLPVLVCYAFDHRTRLGPFLFADMRLLTAGPRAIAG